MAGPRTQTPAEILTELRRHLSPDNENLRRGDIIAAIRDLAQTAVSNMELGITDLTQVGGTMPLSGRDFPGSGRGVTLLELLRFSAQKYMRLNGYLDGLQASLNGEEWQQVVDSGDGDLSPPLTGDRIQLSTELTTKSKRVLEWCRQLCEQIDLQVCVKHVDELVAAVNGGRLGAGDVIALKENVHRELSCHFFIAVPASRRDVFQNGRTGWEDIATAFPSAIDDIEEMNKCYALCRYPSAVMHSLLVVEHGLVVLGPRIGATDPKEGWDASCRQLERVIKTGIDANTTSLDFGQLEQLNTCVQVMKLAWRNKVNHATGKPVLMHGGFGPDVAEEILQASRRFLRRLKIVLGL